MLRWLSLCLFVIAWGNVGAEGLTSVEKTQAREVYAKIISFRSAEGRGQTGPMAAYLNEVLTRAGVPATDMDTLHVGDATAMIVRLRGKDGARPPIIFSAHMDVVDARYEDWQRNPFELNEEQGYFYGRGTADNKAGVTALISTILRFKASKMRPARDLVFAFVGDEETGMSTTRGIAEHPWLKGAEFAINTDAGGGHLGEDGHALIYLVQGAEKTSATFDLMVTNRGGHSSRPREDNAIYQLAHALEKVEAYHFPVMANDLTRSYLAAAAQSQTGALGEALRRFSADPTDSDAADVLAKSPEFVGTTRTTCVATMLEAGQAANALPQAAKATINCRVFPGVSVDSVGETLANAISDDGVKVVLRGHPEASPVSAMRPDIIAAITRAVHLNHPHIPIVPYLESGGSDGKVYRAAGIPTFGSSGLFTKSGETSIHGLNERLPVNAFYDSLDHIYHLAVDLGGAKK